VDRGFEMSLAGILSRQAGVIIGEDVLKVTFLPPPQLSPMDDPIDDFQCL
jgi:hypothetical protein